MRMPLWSEYFPLSLHKYLPSTALPSPSLFQLFLSWQPVFHKKSHDVVKMHAKLARQTWLKIIGWSLPRDVSGLVVSGTTSQTRNQKAAREREETQTDILRNKGENAWHTFARNNWLCR